MNLESVITCPKCGTAKLEWMPTDACQFFYECTGCGAMLRPKPGDCCVFCSYGSVPCPPAWQPKTGRSSTYRSGKAVQTTEASSISAWCAYRRFSLYSAAAFTHTGARYGV